jgi:hypothetical protein
MLKKYILFVLLLILTTCLAIGFFYNNVIEDFQTISDTTLPDQTKYKISTADPTPIPSNGLLQGYYRYSANEMFPYPNTSENNMVTKYPMAADFENELADGYYKVTINGTNYLAELPPRYYQINSSKMARLPTNGYASPIPEDSYKIPYNYYPIKINLETLKEDPTLPSENYITPVPNGYRYDSRTKSLQPLTRTAAEVDFLKRSDGDRGYQYSQKDIENNLKYEKDERTKYDATNIIDYHESAEDLIKKGDSDTGIGFGEMLVRNQNGDLVNIPYVPGQALPVYFKPGSYMYDVKYTPNYEDSIYLSRTTGLSTLGQAYPTTTMMGGFCNSLKHDKTALELKCNSITPDQCASTDCCVLFGGTKCVAGDEKGPTFKSNYTDLYVTNKETYYHKGKCYGNCDA